jgi:hypothetical protein
MAQDIELALAFEPDAGALFEGQLGICEGDDVLHSGHALSQEVALGFYLIGSSRLLQAPLAGLVQGVSGAGKSYTINRVAEWFPPEAVLKVHRMARHASEYVPAGALEHRFVLVRRIHQRNTPVTIPPMVQESGLKEGTVRNRFREMEAFGAIREVSASAGRRPAEYEIDDLTILERGPFRLPCLPGTASKHRPPENMP